MARVFAGPVTHGGDLSPYMGDKCRGQSVNGGPYEGGIDVMGGPN